MDPLSKEALRRAALEARKTFVATLSDAQRAKLEHRLAERLTSLFAGVSVVGGYCPLGSEISPLPAMEEARAVGAIAAYPCFHNPGKAVPLHRRRPARSRAVRNDAAGKRHPVVQPDLVLVPLIAIDGRGTRLGRGKGHYDRALIHLKKIGARLVGVGWPLQRLDRDHPGGRMGHPAQRLRQPRRTGMVQVSKSKILLPPTISFKSGVVTPIWSISPNCV